MSEKAAPFAHRKAAIILPESQRCELHDRYVPQESHDMSRESWRLLFLSRDSRSSFQPVMTIIKDISQTLADAIHAPTRACEQISK